jgi:hypothetical protein
MTGWVQQHINDRNGIAVLSYVHIKGRELESDAVISPGEPRDNVSRIKFLSILTVPTSAYHKPGSASPAIIGCIFGRLSRCRIGPDV